MMNFDRIIDKVAIELIAENDHYHNKFSYRILEVESNKDIFFQEWTKVLEFFSTFSPDLNSGSHGSITPYWIEKESLYNRLVDSGERSTGSYRWASEGEPTGIILWYFDENDFNIKINLEDDYTTGSDIPRDHLTAFLLKNNKSFEVQAKGDGADFENQVGVVKHQTHSRSYE